MYASYTELAFVNMSSSWMLCQANGLDDGCEQGNSELIVTENTDC